MMKLSEAMRLGAMLKPQTRGAMYDGVGTCALGAALDAIGKLPSVQMVVIPRDARVWLPLLKHRTPAGPVESYIVWLNDTARWTREEIADWVESIEQEIEAGQKPADVCEMVSA